MIAEGEMVDLKNNDLAKKSFWHQSCNHLPSSCLTICFLHANGYLEAPIKTGTWLENLNIHTQLIQRSLFSIRQMPKPMEDFFSYLLKKEAIR